MSSALVVSFGDFELDASQFELRRAGKPVAIQRRVMDLLIFLVTHRDRVATREEIFAAVWPGVVVTGAALGQAVMEARRALGDTGEEWIQTVRGRGFRFVGAVNERGVERPSIVAPAPRSSGPPADLVGRDPVWQVVTDALTAVQAGRGSVVVLAGEEGAGKTRLLEDVRAEADARGIGVVSHDLRDGSLSVATLEAALKNGAVVATVDDVHLAPEDALATVPAVARLARRAPLVLLLATSEHHLDPESAPAALQEVARTALVARLDRLAIDDVLALVLARTGRALAPEDAKALHLATGGNPRLVLQLASSGLERSAALRPGATIGSSSDALKAFRRSALARATALSPATRRIVDAAAVLGRDIVVARVAAILEEEPSAVFRAIDEALGANLVRRKTEAVGAYRFAIGMVRDGLYEAIPEERRANLHRAAARLPAGDAPEPMLDRAKHAIRSGPFMAGTERAAIIAQASSVLVAHKRADEAITMVRSALASEQAHGDAEAVRALEATLASALNSR